MSSDHENMTSNRPYLLRALYEWIADNGLTPHVLVDAGFDGVDVPDHAIQDGKIVLNIATGATENLQLENETIFFKARFQESPTKLRCPWVQLLPFMRVKMARV